MSECVNFTMQNTTVDIVTDPLDCFENLTAFEKFLRYEGNDAVAQWASTIWDAGYRSIKSIADVEEEVLRAAHGHGISAFHFFGKARAGAAL